MVLLLPGGGACIVFCLADQNHPNGVGLDNGDFAVTKNQNYGDFTSTWAGYLNIFVQEGTGVLGYSPLFGGANGSGIVIEACVIGSQGSGCGNGIGPGSGCNQYSVYNLGRTATHEAGHYLGLGHIWGNGCGADDGIGDTPNSAGEYFGCPPQGTSSCGSSDQYMNYMDYVNDACMYMFSEGQANIMRNAAAVHWGTTFRDKCSTHEPYPAPALPGGCDPDALNVGFDATPQSGCVGSTVSFTNFSTGAITTYAWDFGNETSSDQENPGDVTYTEAGEFTVTLTIGDGSTTEMTSIDILISDGGTFDHLNGGDLTIIEADCCGGDPGGYITGNNSFDDIAKAEYFAEGGAGAILGDVDFYFDRANTPNCKHYIFCIR